MNSIEIPIKDIVLYERNSNKHSPMQIERLTKSIREFGFLVPCVVKTGDAGKYNLASGHGRLVAAKRAGLKTVPCVVADHLTKKQFSAFVIADNKLAEMGEWDMDILQSELNELVLEGFEVDLLGFDQDEAMRILGLSSEEGGENDRSGEEGEGGGSNDPQSNGGEQEGKGAALRTNIAYNIIFDTDEQQQAWFGFLRYLKQDVSGESIGARLRVFITEGDFTKE